VRFLDSRALALGVLRPRNEELLFGEARCIHDT
jgi:hypothetical protein